MNRNIIKSFFAVTLVLSSFTLTAAEPERKAAAELLEASRFDKTMESSVDAAVQMVKQMHPGLGDKEVPLRKFYEKHLGAKSLRDDVIVMYADIFTEQELKDIAAFYRTKTGQKALEKLPEVMQRTMQIAQARIMQNMGELQEVLSEE